MSMVTIYCWVFGDDLRNMFSVKVPIDKTVGTLKDLIFMKQQNRFVGVVASQLRLIRVSLSIDDNLSANLASLVIKEEPRLLPHQKISSLFQDAPEDHLHIIVRRPIVSLNYLIFGDTPDEIGVVEIPINKTVDTLMDLIFMEQQNRFVGVAASELQLIKVSLPLDDNLSANLTGLVIKEEPRLLPYQEISDLFQDAPKAHLHIIVRRPIVGLKRSTPPSLSLSMHERIKRTKIATTSPSQMAQLFNYKSIQEDTNEKFLDDRPSPDADVAPIELLYHGFGRFEDIIDHHEVYHIPELESAIDAFAEDMSRSYGEVCDRRDKGLEGLNSIFSIFSAHTHTTIPSLSARAIGRANSDGQSLGTHNGPVAIVEFKNEITGIDAFPNIEATTYAAHLHSHMVGEHDLFKRWRIPCLGITIVGHEVRFYAIINLGHRYRLVSLTPTLSCLRSASGGRERKALYTAFVAASVLQTHIFTDFKNHLSAPPPYIPEKGYRFPAVSRLRKYGADDEYTEFQIEEYFFDRQSYRELYLARDSSDTQILVKFSRKYCVELHDHCSKKGLAPRILGFEHLPGGWYGIAMEYISQASPLETPRFNSLLMDLVEGFHKEGLVHGDLRDANILWDEDEKIWLIDFDWGGKDGEAEYPTSNLNPELTAGRTTADLKIRREDDLRILGNTLAKFESFT